MLLRYRHFKNYSVNNNKSDHEHLSTQVFHEKNLFVLVSLILIFVMVDSYLKMTTFSYLYVGGIKNQSRFKRNVSNKISKPF